MKYKLFQGHAFTLTKSPICIAAVGSACLPSVQNPSIYGQIATEILPRKDQPLWLFFQRETLGH